MEKHGRLVIVAVIMVGMLMGCATKQPEKQARSGFLNDYPNFSEAPDGKGERYLKPGVDFTKYKRIMMDEVVFFFNSDADYKGIHPSEIQSITETFHEVFVKKFGDKLTEKPGPDVVRMRMAVTDIEPSNTITSTITTVVPVGLAVKVVKRGVTGEYTGVGTASAEVEFLDSLTNERIAAGIAKVPGEMLDVTKLSPVETTFEFFADRLYTFLQDVKKNSPATGADQE